MGIQTTGTLRADKVTVEDLNRCTAALKNKEKVACDRSGKWYCEGKAMRFIRWLFGCDNRRVIFLSVVFNSCLDELEKQPTRMNDAAASAKYHAYINLGKEIEEHLQKCVSEESRHIHIELTRRVVALQYRIGDIIPLKIGSEQHTKLYGKMQKMLLKRKSSELLSDFDKEISPGDKDRLGELCQYEEFVNLLIREAWLKKENVIKETPLQERVFNWRSHLQPLVEYPAMQQILRDSLLSYRIACFGGQGLQVTTDDGVKDLKMRFETEGKYEKERNADSDFEWISILDPTRKIMLRGNLQLTIGKIFSIFKDKNFAWGEVEFFGNGVCNFHSGRMARKIDGEYQPVNLAQPRWWEQLPQVPWISLEDMQRRSPHLDLNGGKNWVGVNVATRRFPTMVVSGTHGYRKIYIPKVKNGTLGYDIYAFSKFPKEEGFPRTCPQYTTFGAKTWEGEIALDPNPYNAQRQHGGVPFVMTPTEGVEDMKSLAIDVQRGREGKMSYNIFVKNCAQWTNKRERRERLGQERVPKELYQVPLSRAQPMFPIDHIFRCLNRMPMRIQNCVYTIIFSLTGGRTSHTTVWMDRNGVEQRETIWILSPNRRPWSDARKNRFICPAGVDPKIWAGYPGLDQLDLPLVQP